MKVLAIESTCDETGVSVVEKVGDGVKALSNVVASSAAMHEKYGGVVPEVAAREQIKSILPVIAEAIGQAASIDQITKWARENIDAIAVAYGPGLIGSLLIGVETAKTLALAWNKPLIPVNHLVAHIMANWIVETPSVRPDRTSPPWQGETKRMPVLPAVGLVVSGGHTDLVYMKSLTDWQWLGGTRDDAVGECLDKSARILGLGEYLGGALIEKAAEEVVDEEQIFKLPRPLLHEDTYDMSFSGLKAAVAREVERLPVGNSLLPKLLARELSEALVEVLVGKTEKAVRDFGPKSVLLAGGVAASKRLRAALESKCEELSVGFFVPEFKYCTDNAAMIGAAALLRGQRLETKEQILSLEPEPGLVVVSREDSFERVHHSEFEEWLERMLEEDGEILDELAKR